MNPIYLELDIEDAIDLAELFHSQEKLAGCLDAVRDQLDLEIGHRFDVTPFICHGCGVNTSEIAEYYMLTDKMWRQAFPYGTGMLCIGCVEARIGRKLVPADFGDVPLNMFGVGVKSERLMDRLGIEGLKFTEDIA